MELMLAGGASQTSVGRKFGLSHDSIRRHWISHVTSERKTALAIGPVQRMALQTRLAEENISIVDEMKALRAGLWTLLNSAVEAGDAQAGAQLAGRLNACLTSIGRITGDLTATPFVSNVTNNLVIGDAAASVLPVLVKALANYPEAREAVIAAFREVEAQGSGLTLPRSNRVPEVIEVARAG